MTPLLELEILKALRSVLARNHDYVREFTVFPVARLACFMYSSRTCPSPSSTLSSMSGESLSVGVNQHNARKRRKLEETADAQLPDEGTRSEDLWFKEGNIILVAHDLSFKVHSGILCRHSEVFSELLTDSAMSTLPERVEGCPILRVEDKGSDLEELLAVMYDGGKRYAQTIAIKYSLPTARSHYFRRQRIAVPFEHLHALASIAVKYKVEEVIEEAIDRLSMCFPSRHLHDWDPHLQANAPDSTLIIEQQDAIAVVSLARLLKASHLLPTAFYTCCQLDLHVLVSGVTYAGGEIVRLSEEDLKTCLVGRKALLDCNTHVLKSFLEFRTNPALKPSDCASPPHCSRVVQELAIKAADDGLFADPSLHGQLVRRPLRRKFHYHAMQAL